MNPEIKAKWLKGLRSGDFNQGAGCLRSVNKQRLVDLDGVPQDDVGITHCCLGVLCEVTDREFNDGDSYLTPGDKAAYDEDSGLTAYNQERLVCFNDVDELSFGQIAEWIEENL